MRRIHQIIILISSFYLVFYIPLSGQFYVDNAAIYNEAVSYIQGEEYEDALPLLLMLQKKGVSNPNISYNTGLCYINSVSQKSFSIPYLESATKLLSDSYSGKFTDTCAPYKSLLYLGKAYRIDNQLENAEKTFLRLMDESHDTLLVQLAQFNYRQCKVAETMIKYAEKAKITYIDDSSNFSAYNPVVTSANVKSIYFMKKLKFYDAVLSAQIAENKIINPENLTPEIGSDGDLILLGSSENGDMLLFEGYDPGNGFELYYAKKSGIGKWAKHTKFPKPVNSPSNETGACLSADGKTLYFSSNRPGGYGGDDIYKSKLNDDGSWSAPVNLGKRINTVFDEITPHLAPNGKTLYFSSQGHLNMGGFDFFYSVLNKDGTWQKPVNLGYPVSSAGDDLFLCPTDNKAVFYTYRLNPVDGLTKIYKIHLLDSLSGSRTLLSGQLKFSDSIQSKSVVFNVVNLKNNHTKEISETDGTGKYGILLPSGDYSLNFIYNEKTTATQIIHIDKQHSIDELTMEAPVWKIETKKAPFVLSVHDILFAFDSYSLSDQYLPMLDSIARLLNRFGQIDIEIVGYTDSKGSEAYNLQLSEKRAGSVQQYLVSKDVLTERIKTRGMGKTHPVAINTNSDGTDNPSGRRYNRRVDLEIHFSGGNIKILKTSEIPDNLKVKN